MDIQLTSLSLTAGESGSCDRQASRWGFRPSERSTATLCWVGLVFCSPTTPSTGTRLTCTQQKLPGPTLNWNCRTATALRLHNLSRPCTNSFFLCLDLAVYL